MLRYLKLFFLGSIFLALIMIVFVWHIDPYGIYHEVDIDDPNPARIINERIFKTIRLTQTPADVIFLGTSRMNLGFARNDKALKNEQVVNLATFGQPIRESRKLMELAVQNFPRKTIVIGLDFWAFNATTVTPSDLIPDNYDRVRKFNLLLSISSLVDAWKLHRSKNSLDNGECCYRDGFIVPINISGLKGVYREQFIRSEKQFFIEKYKPYPECDFVFSSNKVNDTLEDFREIINLAHRNKIDLKLFITPAHARLWEVLGVMDLWDKWEFWKIQLAKINYEESQKFGVPAFKIYDLSGYDEVSMEELPAAGDRYSIMKNYIDTSHFTEVVGSRILNRIFENSNDTWGKVLEPNSIAEHLQKLRDSRINYRKTNSRDVRDINDEFIEFNKLNLCNKSMH